MEVFLDLLQNKWGHRRSGKSYVWGKKRAILPHRPFSPAVSFTVRTCGKRIGPLVGVLTTPRGSTFAGNRNTFRRIHDALQKQGGILFVFTPQDTEDSRIKGFVFSQNNRWVKTSLPYPDVVYNRVPFRKDEETPVVRSFFKRVHALGIPFFNVSFLDKWEMYECLRQTPMLVPHLPDTRKLSESELKSMLHAWGEVYLKPQAGQKGDGMFIIKRMMDGLFVQRSQTETRQFASFGKLWEDLKNDCEKTPYLLQRKISLMHFEGRPYDFRLMVQKVSGKWNVTGAGARLAGKDSITTHVPKGGELLALEELYPPVNLDRLKTISILAAEQLEKNFSPLNELSFDIGRDQNGHYWLFEANAKPMIFDEPEIEKERMKRLINIFYEKSGF